MAGGFLQLRHANRYSLYVLVCLLFAYMLNQLDRYALAVTSKAMAQDIHFGDKGCVKNGSFRFSGHSKWCSKKFDERDEAERNKTR